MRPRPTLRHGLLIMVMMQMLVGFAVRAQQPEPNGGGNKDLDESFDIVKDYKPKLSDAEKLPIQPRQEEPQEAAIQMNYPLETDPADAPGRNARASAYEGGTQTREEALFRHRLRLGAGNLGTFQGTYEYSSRRARDYALTGHLRHRSGRGPVEDLSSFSNNALGVSGRKLLPQEVGLRGDLSYRREVVHYYGFRENQAIPEAVDAEDIAQRFNHIHVKGGVFRSNRDPEAAPVHWESDIQYHRFSDDYESSEGDLQLDAQVRLPHDETAIYGDFRYRNLGYRYDEEVDFSRHILALGGGYRWQDGPWNFQAGARLATVLQTQDDAFFVYPDLSVEYAIRPGEQLLAYGRLGGGLQPQSMRSLARRNPFIQTTPLTLANTSENIDVDGGVRGAFNAEWSFDLSAGFSLYSDFPYFLNDAATQGRQFVLRYDSSSTSRFRIGASVLYEAPRLFDFYFRPEFLVYQPGDLEVAAHYPGFRLASGATYYLGEKIAVALHATVLGAREAASTEAPDEAIDLDGFADLGLNARYRFSRYLTASLRVNNLLGQEYQYWNQYPVRGFQALGGLGLRY